MKVMLQMTRRDVTHGVGDHQLEREWGLEAQLSPRMVLQAPLINVIKLYNMGPIEPRQGIMAYDSASTLLKSAMIVHDATASELTSRWT